MPAISRRRSACSRRRGDWVLFTTAALQDSYIERIIGLDGVSEFPIYLCGAGVPAKTNRLRSDADGPL
jgi:hypothetical protein